MQDPQERQQDHEFHQPDGHGIQGEPVKSASQARQGVFSGRLATVLLAGMILVIIGFAVSYIAAV